MSFPIKYCDLEDIDHWLVVLTILKNVKVNGTDDIPYIMEKTCLKPPTSYCTIFRFSLQMGHYSNLKYRDFGLVFPYSYTRLSLIVFAYPRGSMYGIFTYIDP